MWEIAANVYREGERDVIYRHCDGEVKAWNATVEVDGYVPTGNIVVIVCNAGLFTCVDIYRKQRNWEVLRKHISSCDDLRYTLPVVRRLLVREGFDDA
ncbi:hypothetical protein, partial [Thermofilum sp.]|uniref:hypothetical protein n=1 Tax=Thermofilum sp. TaxID=1961369 RepID=UPI003171F4DE